MNYIRKKPTKSIFIVFILFPVIFQIIGCVIAYGDLKIKFRGIQSEGIIIDVKVSRNNDGTSYSPVVEYSCGAEEKIISTTSLSSGKYPNVGDTISIYCIPGTTDFILDSFMGQYFGIFFFAFATLFQSIGIYGFYTIMKKQKQNIFLQKNGSEILVPIVFIGYDESIKVNGRYPMIITCQLHDENTNNVYEFRSENIWLHDISDFVKIGDTRKIFVKIKNGEKDYSKYYVDISDIPIAK